MVIVVLSKAEPAEFVSAMLTGHVVAAWLWVRGALIIQSSGAVQPPSLEKKWIFRPRETYIYRARAKCKIAAAEQLAGGSQCYTFVFLYWRGTFGTPFDLEFIFCQFKNAVIILFAGHALVPVLSTLKAYFLLALVANDFIWQKAYYFDVIIASWSRAPWWRSFFFLDIKKNYKNENYYS